MRKSELTALRKEYLRTAGVGQAPHWLQRSWAHGDHEYSCWYLSPYGDSEIVGYETEDRSTGDWSWHLA